jgi:betaine-aldehyde dehydrogenase
MKRAAGSGRRWLSARVLLRLAELIRANAEELARLESSNVGKPIGESRGEIAMGADCFQFYAGQIPSFGGRTVPISAPGASLAHRRWSTTASRRACLSPRTEE